MGAYHKRKGFFMEGKISDSIFTSVMVGQLPEAVAWIRGNTEYPNLSGVAMFFEAPFGGVLVEVEVYGLPEENVNGFYGLHIHEFGNCTHPFDKTGDHYNPNNLEHPRHAGDMPPLLGNDGYAWTAFYDERFTIDEIIGRSIVIHDMRDDFSTQPSGDSGTKIGCGEIIRNAQFENRDMRR